MSDPALTINFEGEYCINLGSKPNVDIERDFEGVVFFEGKIYRILRPLELIDDTTICIKFNPGNYKLFPLDKLKGDGQVEKISIIILNRKGGEECYQTAFVNLTLLKKNLSKE